MSTAEGDRYERVGIRDLLPKDLREGLTTSRVVLGFCSSVLEIHPFQKSWVRNLSLPSKHRLEGDALLRPQRSPKEKGKTNLLPKI